MKPYEQELWSLLPSNCNDSILKTATKSASKKKSQAFVVQAFSNTSMEKPKTEKKSRKPWFSILN